MVSPLPSKNASPSVGRGASPSVPSTLTECLSSSPPANMSSSPVELSSLYSFLIQLCLTNPNPTAHREQHSIAEYILRRFSPEIESNPSTYEFLSLPFSPREEDVIVPEDSPRKRAKKLQTRRHQPQKRGRKSTVGSASDCCGLDPKEGTKANAKNTGGQQRAKRSKSHHQVSEQNKSAKCSSIITNKMKSIGSGGTTSAIKAAAVGIVSEKKGLMNKAKSNFALFGSPGGIQPTTQTKRRVTVGSAATGSTGGGKKQSAKGKTKRRSISGRPITSHGQRTQKKSLSDESLASIKSTLGSSPVRFKNTFNRPQMLFRLFKAIEFTSEQLSVIALCRLFQGYMKCCTDVAHFHLRQCTKLDAVNHCLRAIRPRLEAIGRQQAFGTSTEWEDTVALDTLAATVLCILPKDQKFGLKIRLSGQLHLLVNHVLHVGPQPSLQLSFGTVNLLRLAARSLRSARNVQLVGQVGHFAERFVLALNAASALSLLEEEHQPPEQGPTTSFQHLCTADPFSSNFASEMDSGFNLKGIRISTMSIEQKHNHLAQKDEEARPAAAAKIARLMEMLFLLAKNKRNNIKFLDQQVLPVLKTIFETHFNRRTEHLVHREIALIALASLRQFSKTKKGRDQLMSLNTLDMCEQFIAELGTERGLRTAKVKEEEGKENNDQGKPIDPFAQLEDSLCALCLRCLPQKSFPHSLETFPFRFELPKEGKGKPLTEEAKSSKVAMKNLKLPRNSMRRSSETMLRRSKSRNRTMTDEEGEEEGAISSDDDYGLLGMSNFGGAEMAEDSLMSCGGGTAFGQPEDEDEEEVEQEEADNEKSDGKREDGRTQTAKSLPPPLGSEEAVALYNRQSREQLIMNYKDLFAEFSLNQQRMKKKENDIAQTVAVDRATIVRRFANVTKSVGQFVSIAFPELLDEENQHQQTNDHLAAPSDDTQNTCSSLFSLSSSSLTAADAVREMLRQEQQKKFSERRVIFDLDQMPPLVAEGRRQFELDNDDQRLLGYQLVEPADGTGHLHFESRFEGGNLWKAIKVGPTSYELVLSPDINQRQLHFQWFYFRVSGMRANVPYTFEFVNCLKSASMFTKGMQPVLFSVAEAICHGRPGWIRAGEAIAYFPNLFLLPAKDGPVGNKDPKNKEIDDTPLRRRTRSVTRALATSSTANLPTPNVISFGGAQSSHLKVPNEQKNHQSKDKLEARNFFSLRFTIQFQHQGDICYLAYHFPYTYTRLQCSLERLISSSSLSSSILLRRQELPSNTLAGNSVPLITITASPKDGDFLPLERRNLILITARVHPGESNSSWIMQGILHFLMSQNPLAARARELFVFKLVPMLNPDGVVNGSHRCSLAGQDLNRVWNDPSSSFHPTVFHTKGLIQYSVDVLQNRPFAFVDLHGHSRKPNIFMYGNNPDESWRQLERQEQQQQMGEIKNGQHSLLPQILDKISDFFTLKDCAFSITKCKEYSARVATWRQFQLERVYTMESSYWGFDTGPFAGRQITIEELMKMGAQLVEGLVLLREKLITEEAEK